MSKFGKLILGTLTLLPFVIFTFYIASFFQFFGNVLAVNAWPQVNLIDLLVEFYGMMFFIGIAVLLCIVLLVYYLVHISKNPKFIDSSQSSRKIVWILVVIFTGIVGMIAYFFVEIWPAKKNDVGDI